MAALDPAAEADTDLSLDLVEIGYVGEDGTEQRASLGDAPRVAFESCTPVRRFCGGRE